MREIRTSGSMSGGGKRSYGRDLGTGTKAKAAGNSDSLDLQATAPAADSTLSGTSAIEVPGPAPF